MPAGWQVHLHMLCMRVPNPHSKDTTESVHAKVANLMRLHSLLSDYAFAHTP